MDLGKLQNEIDAAGGANSHRFTTPEAISNPINNRMGEIGQRLLTSRKNYEDALKNVMGSNAENKVNIDQVVQALASCEVELTRDQRLVLDLWFSEKQDVQRRVSVITFLKDIGLPAQTMSAHNQN